MAISENQKLENIRVKYQASVNINISESQIQWSRFSAILVGNTIILTMLGSYYSDPKFQKELSTLFHLMPVLGILICLNWIFVTAKGFKWTQFWIDNANELEAELIGGINPVIKGGDQVSRIWKTEYAAYFMIIIFLVIFNLILIYNPPVIIYFDWQYSYFFIFELVLLFISYLCGRYKVTIS